MAVKHSVRVECSTQRLTGSADKVASFTFLAASSSYFRARRPISVVHTGCNSSQVGVKILRQDWYDQSKFLRQSSDGTHREVCRMREKDCPRALDPLVPVHWPLSCVSVKVGDNIAKTQNLTIVSATHIDRYALAYNNFSSQQENDARSYPIGRALRVELCVQLGAGLDIGVTHGDCSEKV